MWKPFSVLLCAWCTFSTAIAQNGVCRISVSRQVATTQYYPGSYTDYYRCGGLFRRRRCSRTRYNQLSRIAYREVLDNLFNCCSGYMRVGTSTTCRDINECSDGSHQCEQVCTNTEGSYTCSCHTGYRPNSARTCQDVNECNERSHRCNQMCENTIGSYRCLCHSGYRLINSHTCREIDECAENSHHCEQTCTNTDGSYICSCQNRDRLNIDGRTCQAPPSPPEPVVASQVGATSGIVSWSPPQHSDSSVLYNLFCSDAETRYRSHRFSSLHVLEKTIQGLHPYTNYTCCVTAINYAGEGESSCDSFLTNETEPSAAPNVTEVNTTSTSLELQWDHLPLPESNGAILGYIIHYQHTETGLNTTQNTSDTSIRLMNLKPFSVYEFAIAAYTSAGIGPYGPFYQEQTDEDVPSGPPENISSLLTSPDSFLLEWSPPLETLWNGIIIGYVVKLEKENQFFDHQNTSDTNYTFTGLQKDMYYCSIAAQTRIGTGPFSEKVELSNNEEAETESRNDNNNNIISIAGGSTGALLVVICVAIVLIVILMCRRKHDQKPQQKSSVPTQTHQTHSDADDNQRPPQHYVNDTNFTTSLQTMSENVEENEYAYIEYASTNQTKEIPVDYMEPTTLREKNAEITGQKKSAESQYMPLSAATLDRYGDRNGGRGVEGASQYAGHYITPQKNRAKKIKN